MNELQSVKTSFFYRVGISVAMSAATMLATVDASAIPTKNCYDAVDRPNVIYVAGSTAVRTFLGVVAAQLAASSPSYTVVYQAQGSCTGVAAVYSDDPTKRVMKDITTNYATFYNADGTSEQCFLDPMGNTVDVGASDVYAASCAYDAPPMGVQIADYLGPIQPMVFVVPALSTQKSISAEAAYMAFGTGGNNSASAPWIDPTYFFVRNASSGTQQMVARAINVPAEKWWGKDRGGSSGVVNGIKVLLDQSLAEKAIGILSTDTADANRDTMRILALQSYGQNCAYYPDSTPFLTDKKNVRDGHYPLWGPVHFYTRVTGGIPSAAAGALVTQFAAAKLSTSLVETIAKKFFVPKCSMHVDRSSEMGPLKTYTTDSRCDCFFEKTVNGTTSCQACVQAAECPASAPACSYGYCETP